MAAIKFKPGDIAEVLNHEQQTYYSKGSLVKILRICNYKLHPDKDYYEVRGLNKGDYLSWYDDEELGVPETQLQEDIKIIPAIVKNHIQQLLKQPS